MRLRRFGRTPTRPRRTFLSILRQLESGLSHDLHPFQMISGGRQNSKEGDRNRVATIDLHRIAARRNMKWPLRVRHTNLIDRIK